MASDETRARRAPEGEGRRRDAERTRRALLDAALEEFAEKGRAGARVSEIAARAGVNKQLISYYFGGKEGLYRAIVERWHAQEAAWEHADLSLEDLVVRYLQASVEQPALQRLFLRELLDTEQKTQRGDDEEARPAELEDLLRRQEAGEIAKDVDPGLALILLQGAVSAGILFAADVRAFTGREPTSRDFLERYGALLRRVVRALGRPDA